jgi:class 3 adenylate cyclase
MWVHRVPMAGVSAHAATRFTVTGPGSAIPDAEEAASTGSLQYDELTGKRSSGVPRMERRSSRSPDSLTGAPDHNRAVADRAGGVVTFVLTDIEGSSRHWEAHPEAMQRALAIHDRVIEAYVRAYGGTVKTNHGEGDSFFAVFPLATQAVAAACAIQQELAMQPWPQHVTPLVRMAIHTGESSADDHRGRVPNRCSRVRGFARGGQVLLTAATAELVQDSLPPAARLVDMGEHELRDIPRPERIFELIVPPADPSHRGGTRHTLEEIDARLADLDTKAAVVTANLVDLQELVAYKVLAGTSPAAAGLTGVTESRVRPALEAMQDLWLHFSALTDLIERAKAERGTSRKLRSARVDELDRMLFGASVRLPARQVPLAQRGLLQAGETDETITPDDLLRAMEHAFDAAKNVVLAVDDVWQRVVPRLDERECEAEALAERARPRDAAAAEALDAVGAKIRSLRELADTDPLGIASDFDGDVVPALDAARARLDELERRRHALPADLARARDILRDLRDANVRGRAMLERASARIAGAAGVREPRDAASIAHAGARLAAIERLAASGPPERAREELDAWLAEAGEALADERSIAAANQAPLDRRAELRGLLDALKAKARALGLLEDPELSELARQATALLFTAPTDLDAAADVVTRYREGLSRPQEPV